MWALDLGTTNSLLARWDPETGAPAIVKLPRLSRAPSAITSEHRADSAQQAPLFADRGVPSALEVIASPTLWARLGRVGWLSRLAPGALAHIGQPAIVRHALHPDLAEILPYVGAVVELDGTQGAGARMIVNIVDCDVDAVRCGDKVEVVWEHVNEAMTTPRFRPVR